MCIRKLMSGINLLMKNKRTSVLQPLPAIRQTLARLADLFPQKLTHWPGGHINNRTTLIIKSEKDNKSSKMMTRRTLPLKKQTLNYETSRSKKNIRWELKYLFYIITHL